MARDAFSLSPIERRLMQAYDENERVVRLINEASALRRQIREGEQIRQGEQIAQADRAMNPFRGVLD